MAYCMSGGSCTERLGVTDTNEVAFSNKKRAEDALFTIALFVNHEVYVAGIHNNITILPARVQRPSSISQFKCNKKVSKRNQTNL